MDIEREREAIANQISILELEHGAVGRRLDALQAAKRDQANAIEAEIAEIDEELEGLGFAPEELSGDSADWDREWTEREQGGDGMEAQARAAHGATEKAAAQADFSAPPRGSAEQQGGFDVGKAMDEYADKNRQAGGKAFPWE